MLQYQQLEDRFLPQESRTQSMEHKPKIYIEGIGSVIKQDLKKHKVLLQRSKTELLSYREARSHEIKKKKYYNTLIGGGKFDDESLRNSINDIGVNIRHMSDKVKLSEDAIKHHTLIVDTLTDQLDNYNKGMRELTKSRRNENAIRNRLV